MVNWKYKPDITDSRLLDMKSADEIDLAKQYEVAVLWPISWKRKARDLLYVADKLFSAYKIANNREWARFEESFKCLEPQPSGHILNGQELEDHFDITAGRPIYLLLTGYAIENLIKGIIYSKTPSLLEEDDKNLRLKKDLANHKLADLYIEAGLAANKNMIDNDIKELLDYLEEYITWKGRYNIPLNLQQAKNAKSMPSCINHGGDIVPDKINELVEQLITELDRIPVPPTHLAGDK